MGKKLVVAAALAAAASVGVLAAPAQAASLCSSAFCFQNGPTSATAWTNVGPLATRLTVVSPVWSILP